MQRWLPLVALLVYSTAAAHSVSQPTTRIQPFATKVARSIAVPAPAVSLTGDRVAGAHDKPAIQPATTVNLGSSGGGAVSLFFFAALWLAVMAAAMRRRWALSRSN